MHVGVGSGNPVKRRAVESVLENTDGFDEATVEAVPVDSGVSEQPVGHAETVQGAETRAANALESGDYDLVVGIEGGVARFEGASGLFLVMWAAVDDGETTGLGSGPSLRLPDSIAERVDSGEELGPVMDDVLDESNVAKRQGAAGALTGGSLDRQSALGTAVSGAFGPFVTEHY